MIKTAVIYARYSSDSQTEQSIDGQLRVCEEYAKQNDILVLDTYIDRAMTGTNDNRPDFQRMIRDSAKKTFGYVLVYKFDRFSRNKYETAIHKKALKDNGVKVVSATEFVPDTPEGIIFESMLEGYAEYYSAELSQKIRRGNNESRRKGNLTGGKIPYGYKNVNKKAVIVPEEADIVRYIYEQYSIGVYVKDIIAELNSKGLLHKGKPFVANTVYGILGNERYSGIYRHNGEVFDNIYPQIVPKETFDKVRAKVNANKFGKRSEHITYLLKDKIKCGYCGRSVIGDNGTAHNGERKYYYTCQGRKKKLTDCRKQSIRKDILEKIVLECVIEQIQKANSLNYIVSGIMKEQERQSQANIVLNLLLKERRTTENAIKNIMTAIENGGTTNTVMNRLRELENRQAELERQILIEKSKTAVQLTEKQIREFYSQALALDPELLINYLVKQVTLYDDKIEIQFNAPINISPDDESRRGFSLCSKTVKLSYKVPFRANLAKHEFEVEIYM